MFTVFVVTLFLRVFFIGVSLARIVVVIRLFLLLDLDQLGAKLDDGLEVLIETEKDVKKYIRTFLVVVISLKASRTHFLW